MPPSRAFQQSVASFLKPQGLKGTYVLASISSKACGLLLLFTEMATAAIMTTVVRPSGQEDIDLNDREKVRATILKDLQFKTGGWVLLKGVGRVNGIWHPSIQNVGNQIV